jgi:hypothetical protein
MVCFRINGRKGRCSTETCGRPQEQDERFHTLLFILLRQNQSGHLGQMNEFGPLSRAKRWSREHFFSGSVHPSNPVDDSRKVAMYGDRPQEAYVGRTWTGVGSVRVMLVGFFPTWCTSIRITATLRYE